MINFDTTILYYNRIKSDLGVKFIIVHPDNMTVKAKTKIYSKLSVNCIPGLCKNKDYDFASICLNTLDILPGNIKDYFKIIILYDNSNEDKIYSLDLDDLDNYDGDIFEMDNGVLVNYVDSKNSVIIKQCPIVDSSEDIYSCYINNSSRQLIPSIFDEPSNSIYVDFARRFIESVVNKVNNDTRKSSIVKVRKRGTK